MKQHDIFLRIVFIVLFSVLIFQVYAQAPEVREKKKIVPVTPQQSVSAHGSAGKSVIIPKKDTLVVVARLIEIPGKFAPNDLYNYVYIMKYRILKVVQGAYSAHEILVGHYNPRIPRRQIHDKMASNVKGDLSAFEVNEKHRLVLIHPVECIWKDAVEDEYTDSDMEKYFAVKVDKVR